jgi:hypothetical protein
MHIKKKGLAQENRYMNPLEDLEKDREVLKPYKGTRTLEQSHNI